MHYMEWNGAWETGTARVDFHHKIMMFVVNDLAALLDARIPHLPSMVGAANSFIALAHCHLHGDSADHAGDDLAAQAEALDRLFAAIHRASSCADELTWFSVLQDMADWLHRHLGGSALSDPVTILPAPS